MAAAKTPNHMTMPTPNIHHHNPATALACGDAGSKKECMDQRPAGVKVDFTITGFDCGVW